MLAFQPGDPIDRQAVAGLRDKTRRTTYEGVVSVTRRMVTSWREVPNVQPPIMFEEFVAAEQAVKSDPRWQEAMRRRGIEDFESAMIDAWPLGYNGPDDDPSAGRFIRPLTWVRRGGPVTTAMRGLSRA
ncbi:MAG: hypothetical protein M3170_08640 [Candidatus Dormibacteraeota bacterium]|nr:hypothetical protein [Candidatus Dormibacteraeota bacterium]